MIARVPGSSANLGPGFDALGLALDLHAEVGVIGVDPIPERGRAIDGYHPATIAFRSGGGEGDLWLRCVIPMGRGLGFSGAVRVAGLLAAAGQRGEDSGRRPGGLLAAATELEGHADNVAASLLGGLVATAGGHAVRVPLGVDPAIVTWVPSSATSTDDSRRRLPPTLSREDAVFNIGRTALLVAALATGDVDALREATADRIHQDVRLAAAPGSRAALAAAWDMGVWCAWLSGSGPTVAMMCDPADATAVSAGLPADGQAKVLRVDTTGAVLVPTAP